MFSLQGANSSITNSRRPSANSRIGRLYGSRKRSNSLGGFVLIGLIEKRQVQPNAVVSKFVGASLRGRPASGGNGGAHGGTPLQIWTPPRMRHLLSRVVARSGMSHQLRPVCHLDLYCTPGAVALLICGPVAQTINLAQVLDDLTVDPI